MDRNENIFLRLQIEGNTDAVNRITELKQEISNLKTELKETASSSKDAEKAMADLKEEGKAGTKEYKELQETIQKNTDKTKDLELASRAYKEEQKSVNKELNKSIRDFEKFGQAIPEDSIEGLARRYSDLRKAVRLVPKDIRDLSKEFDKGTLDMGKLNKETRESVIEFRKMQKEAKETKEEIMDFDGEINDFTSNIGNYVSALGGYAGSLPGIIGQIGKGLSGLSDLGGGGLGFASGGGGIPLPPGLANLATALGPAGLVAGAAVAGAAVITDYVAGVTIEFEKLFNEVVKVTQASGDEIVGITAKTKAFSEVFDQDFNRVLEATNNTAVAFGEDFGDTLDLVTAGFLNLGVEAQGTFLDSLREYPKLIADAGLNLKEFIQIQIISAQRGIFDDKAIDSIKEANIALKELDTTQQQVLDETVGKEFRESLEDNLRSGAITAVDAISQIQNKLVEIGADEQDYARITADVFKGAGEDANGFREVMEIVAEAVSSSVDGLSVPQDAYTQRLVATLEASEELAIEQGKLASQFAGTGITLENLGTQLKTIGTALLGDIILGFRGMFKEIKDGDGVLGTLEGILRSIFSLLDGFTGGFLGDVVSGITGINLGVREEVFEEIVKQDQKALNEIKKGESEAAKVQRETEERETLAAQKKRAAQKRAAASAKELAEKLKKVEKDRVAQEKKASKEREALAKAEEARIKKEAADREKATDTLIKLEGDLLKARGENVPEDDSALFEDRVALLKAQAEELITDLVGDPDQIKDQAKLIRDILKENVEKIKSDRTELLATDEIDLFRLEETLKAQEEFNEAIEEAGVNPEDRLEAEKELQIKLLEIKKEAFEKEIEALDLNTEERTEKLIAIAETEREIEEKKNQDLLVMEEELRAKQAEFLEKYNELNRAALEGIGEAIGTFFVNAAKDGEDALKEFGKAIISTLLDLIFQQITLLVTTSFAQPDSVTSFGASGAARVAVITGLMTGALGALKGLLVNSFESGGIIPYAFPSLAGGKIIGPSHENGGVNFVTKGGFVGQARGGEIILNETQQKALEDNYGADVLGVAGVPGFSVGPGSDAGSFTPNVVSPSFPIFQDFKADLNDKSINKLVEGIVETNGAFLNSFSGVVGDRIEKAITKAEAKRKSLKKSRKANTI